MSRFVNWMQWERGEVVGHGVMAMCDAEKKVLYLGREAKELLDKTGVDHVLYSVKKYDADGWLTDVWFYMEPMDDARFEAFVSTIKNDRVYARHKEIKDDV